MDEHEKLHYKSFFRCQSYLFKYQPKNFVAERAYICDTCNKQFDRLYEPIMKFLAAVSNAKSQNIKIPRIPDDINTIEKSLQSLKFNQDVNDAKEILRKGTHILERAIDITQTAPSLTKVHDSKLMKALFRNESRIIQLPKIYGTRMFKELHLISSMTYADKHGIEELTTVEKDDVDDFLLSLKREPSEFIKSGAPSKAENVKLDDSISQIIEDIDAECYEEFNGDF